MAKHAKLIVGALVVAGLVALLPELFGPGLRADFGVGRLLSSGALLLPVALCFLGGLVTALTPCVFPLIPITVAVFGVKQGVSRGRAIALTVVYIQGISLMYTTLGVAAAATGMAFGSWLSSPWIICGLVLLLVAFALSLFGAFDFNLPSSLQNRLASVAKAGFMGAFLMGLVAGLVAAPCTGPVLSAVLVHVAAKQNIALGAVLLYSYSLGLGLPFFLLGGLSISLPKSGSWMESVKSVLAIGLLGLAAAMLRDAFPVLRAALTVKTVAYGAILASGLVGVGVLAGAVHRTFHSWPLDGLLKGLGVVLVVAGLTLRAGAPLARPQEQKGPPVDWLTSEEAGIAQAKAFGKPMIIDFGAEWCTACKELERYVYADPVFKAEASRFVLVKIDGTEETPAIEALYKKYRVDSLPTVVFLDSQGTMHGDITVKGFFPTREFVEFMKKVK